MAKKTAASTKPTEMAKFVILPARGLKAAKNSTQFDFFATLEGRVAKAAAAVGATSLPRPKLRVLDSIAEDKAKLVEMSEADLVSLKRQEPGLRIVPVVYYKPALAPIPTIAQRATAMNGGTPGVASTWDLQVVSATDNHSIAKARVIAFTDFAARQGAEGYTKSNGKLSLNLGGSTQIERLYIYPPAGYWGHYRTSLTTNSVIFKLEPIVFPVNDSVAHFYGPGNATDGQGVTVAVVDTGVGPHPDLTADATGSENTVQGENASDFESSGDDHGTHVAGIIASLGTAPSGRLGIAPAVRLLSFRVFGHNQNYASNYAIAKAIDHAVIQGADLINLSLGGGPIDPAITSAIADARAAGSVVIAAAGNDGRSPVSFPGLDQRAISVSAMGRKGTFPTHSVETADIALPFGTDQNDFVAAFSNIGPEIDVTSAGVGVVSTVSGGYIAMNGTSMSCPAVTGVAARLLSQQPSLVNSPRNQARSDAIVQLVLAAATPLGFGAVYEGAGLPR